MFQLQLFQSLLCNFFMRQHHYLNLLGKTVRLFFQLLSKFYFDVLMIFGDSPDTFPVEL